MNTERDMTFEDLGADFDQLVRSGGTGSTAVQRALESDNGLVDASIVYQERTLKATTSQRVEVQCDRCLGAKYYLSYGRHVGKCFKCNGTGKILRAASYEVNKAKREAKKVKAAADAGAIEAERIQRNIDKFKVARPDLAAWLAANTSDFALSLRDTVADYGNLSVGQEAAIRRNLPSSAEAPRPSFPKIEAMVRNENLKLHLGNCKVTAFRNGAVGVVSTTFGKAQYGIIEHGGALKRFGAMTDAIFATLQDVEARGLQAVKEIGVATGRCCVCARTLTDPTSIEQGIGPICATRVSW